MFFVRVLGRKKFFFRFCVFACILFVFQTFRLLSHEFEANIPIKQSNSSEKRHERVNDSFCSVSNNRHASDADIFTYDLPMKTNYSFVTGKRFKEYVIPVHSEKVAHASHLDHVTVLIIPFSHVDPGYGATMEVYYSYKTKATLDNMVAKLHQYRNMTFQWAETVFLERWWRDINDNVKARVREQVQRGQLEIVTGGWVMPDEASTHYVAVIDQLVEGHQWLIEELGVKPENSWSNDPFGFSSTMPYLWKKSGMDNMVILRIHQAIKATLMKQKAVEFNWRQLWSNNPANEILCHLMPYRGYWIGDTCGPYNQHICREYAFMHTEAIHKVVFINNQNLAERARILYEQYRITSEIYRRHGEAGQNNGEVKLYLPMFLGEDFSYTSAGDFDRIYDNYKLLMDYINEKKEWKMTLKYGTLKEYFSSIRQFQTERSKTDGSSFPTLSGDFFPYSDYQNDYWTGYYTTRPFNKQMGRELQSVVRMADIFHSYALANNKSGKHSYNAYKTVSLKLRSARREQAVFQHHDGITGTSIGVVTYDFGMHLWQALNQAQSALEMIAKAILLREDDPSIFLQSTTHRDSHTSVTTEREFTFSDSGSILFVLNSFSRKRTEVVSFLATDPVVILDDKNNYIPVEYRELISLKRVIRVYFSVDVPPLGIQPFRVRTVAGLNEVAFTNDITHFYGNVLFIENDYMRVEFDSVHGSLLSIETYYYRGNIRTRVTTRVMKYVSGRSGAYIFAPKGEARALFTEYPRITSSSGTIVSDVKIEYQNFTIRYWLNHVRGVDGKSLYFKTELDLKAKDTEVILRFQTDISSGNRFFTDQNGFQLMGRRTYPDRPIEQNYYPMTSMMVVEDDSKRVTLHAGQPHGVASLHSGWMEIMLDRSVSRDDNKGLGQGITDNKLTHAHFAIHIERIEKRQQTGDFLYTFPSATSVLINQIITNPLYSLVSTSVAGGTSLKRFSPMKYNLPCNIQVVSMRNLAKSNLDYNGTSLILHHTPAHCAFRGTRCSADANNTVSLASIFSGLEIHSAKETSLTHLNELKHVHKTESLKPAPMELRSFKIEF